MFLQSHKEATRTETDAKNTVAANHNHFYHEDLEVHFLLEKYVSTKAELESGIFTLEVKSLNRK